MKAIIDRFEDNNLAVLELDDQPGNMLTVSVDELPNNACQGDVLYYQDGSWIRGRNRSATHRYQRPVQLPART